MHAGKITAAVSAVATRIFAVVIPLDVSDEVLLCLRGLIPLQGGDILK